jgi:hypothetical protein
VDCCKYCRNKKVAKMVLLKASKDISVGNAGERLELGMAEKNTTWNRK